MVYAACPICSVERAFILREKIVGYGSHQSPCTTRLRQSFCCRNCQCLSHKHFDRWKGRSRRPKSTERGPHLPQANGLEYQFVRSWLDPDMGARRNFSTGGQRRVDILLIFLRLLTMQCKRTSKKLFTLSALLRKRLMLWQQSQISLCWQHCFSPVIIPRGLPLSAVIVTLHYLPNMSEFRAAASWYFPGSKYL